MRQIKFRGKRLNDEWLFGYLIKQGAYFFIQNEKGGNDCVIEPTVGQFTGLTDRNGKEGYKGDIVRYEDLGIGVIEWDSVLAQFFLNFGKDYEMRMTILSDSEIIGNIFDNPELLNEKQ